VSTWKELKDNPRLKEIYQKRTEIIRLTREFFWSQNFIETDTPVAVKLASQEPYLHPVELKIHDPYGKEEHFYLHTSPEFALKKLLAGGFSHIFEISKCFRDYEEFGGTHNTEFTMLEWYRSPGVMEEFMNDTENLFKYISQKLQVTSCKYQEKKVSIVEDWERKTMKELWKEYVGVNLDNYLTIEEIKKLAESKNYVVEKEAAYEDVFFKIFLNEIEPYLGIEKPLFVYNYPGVMCSLSENCDDDVRYGKRAELYIAGLEIANGFGELVDATLQKEKLLQDQKLRNKLGKKVWDIDEDFISALESGIPKSAGIALGVDRMVLLFTAAHDLNEVIFGSVSDQLATNN